MMSVEGHLSSAQLANKGLADVLDAASAASRAAEALAERDPLGMFDAEIKRLNREYGDLIRANKAEAKADPLNFLAAGSIAGHKAAEGILRSSDAMIAAYRRYGAESPEWRALQEIAIARIVRRDIDKIEGVSAAISGGKGALYSDEVIRALFPGNTYKDLQDIAELMRFWASGRTNTGDTAASMQGRAVMSNPVGAAPGPAKPILRFVPGGSAFAAEMVKWYYTTIRKLTQNPENTRKLMEHIKRGGTERERALAVLFGPEFAAGTGAGAGTALYQSGGEDAARAPQAPVATDRPWRELYREQYGRGAK
jgi:hypothetical protein